MELLGFLNEDRYFHREVERGFAELKHSLADLTAEIASWAPPPRFTLKRREFSKNSSYATSPR
jgi:hypothetical protein